MYANYQYSLTSAQQSAIQLFLRLAVDKKFQKDETFQLLHNLTYATSWTKDKPEFKLAQK